MAATESASGGALPRIKVCGIRRREDALLALAEGAWALGLVFHRPSPRAIEPAEAAQLLAEVRREAGREFLAVGVFVDWPIAALQEVVDSLVLDAAQLHGAETPEYAAAIRAREVWKAIRVNEGFDLAALERYPARVRLLLDSHRPGRPGGTGETFDWEVARAAQARRPIILAGGLRPENVAQALRAVRPDAVDVSSGVEGRPGEKDPERLRAFFREARRGVAFSAPGV
jgi:phosphoribosylanthranilate isomerase